MEWTGISRRTLFSTISSTIASQLEPRMRHLPFVHASHGGRIIRSGTVRSLVSHPQCVSHFGVASRPVLMPRLGPSVPYHVNNWKACLPPDGFRGHPPFVMASDLRMEALAQRHRATFGVFFCRARQPGAGSPFGPVFWRQHGFRLEPLASFPTVRFETESPIGSGRHGPLDMV
jgi:hypothetical protein